VTKSSAIEILIQIWDSLENITISRDWQICTDDFGPEQHLDGVEWQE
jgi:hypothetical protein